MVKPSPHYGRPGQEQAEFQAPPPLAKSWSSDLALTGGPRNSG